MKKNAKYSDLGMLSDAILQAGERNRREQAKLNKVPVYKNCPCHGKQCEEQKLGGRPCGPGVCVRMR